MATLAQLAFAPPDATERDKFSIFRVVFFLIVHGGVIAVFWHTRWWAIALCAVLHSVFGGIGICVGYHRLLTHRSFKCPKYVEYILAFLGILSVQGDPIEWVALHRKHHQHSDAEGDPHSAREGFWWSHMIWVLWIPSRKKWDQISKRYAPDLLKDPFYRFLARTNYLWTGLAALVMFTFGGWPLLIWGMCVRLVLSYHITWLVNSASHTFGYKNFDSKDLSTNCWWVALLAYGEGWHNNHHAFPTSARHGMKPWEIDFSYYFIKLLKAVGLAWDLYVPSAEKMAAALLPPEPQEAEETA